VVGDDAHQKPGLSYLQDQNFLLVDGAAAGNSERIQQKGFSRKESFGSIFYQSIPEAVKSRSFKGNQ
jgi:hypothetical protein